MNIKLSALAISLALVGLSGCQALQQQWGELQPSLQRDSSRGEQTTSQTSQRDSTEGQTTTGDTVIEGRLLALTPTSKRLFDQKYNLKFSVASRETAALHFDKVSFHMWLGGREFIHGIEPKQLTLTRGKLVELSLPAYANMLDWSEDAKMVKLKGRDEYAYLLNIKLDSDKLLSTDRTITIKGKLDLVDTEQGLIAENIR